MTGTWLHSHRPATSGRGPSLEAHTFARCLNVLRDCRNVCWGGGSMLVEARHQKPTDARAASMYLGMAAMCAGRAAACSLSTST